MKGLVPPRARGVLLHISSLPEKGIGDLGVRAYEFIDILSKANIHYWQVLPLHPTGDDNSPYNALSALAGNELFISLPKLVELGLLRKGELEKEKPVFPEGKVDYKAVALYKHKFFKLAAQRFDFLDADYVQFTKKEQVWLEDYVLFRACKKYFGNLPWPKWEKNLVFREREALARYKNLLEGELKFFSMLQYLFHRQWKEVQAYAKKKEISLIGDLPIFISHDSVDVWVNKDLFKLDQDLEPTVVTGVPPDYFSELGQRWGNPHYNWEKQQKNDFLWWRQRLDKLYELVDIVRIDHFRGFEAAWEIPREAKDAVTGFWAKGPDKVFFETILKYRTNLPIIAEDLGYITEEVEELKGEFSFPGMKVLQFLLEEKKPQEAVAAIDANTILYTGTHDNDTILGWYKANEKLVQKKLKDVAFNTYADEAIADYFINLALNSKAKLVIIPFQDILALDSASRMNTPGTISADNWVWQSRPEDLEAILK